MNSLQRGNPTPPYKLWAQEAKLFLLLSYAFCKKDWTKVSAGEVEENSLLLGHLYRKMSKRTQVHKLSVRRTTLSQFHCRSLWKPLQNSVTPMCSPTAQSVHLCFLSWKLSMSMSGSTHTHTHWIVFDILWHFSPWNTRITNRIRRCSQPSHFP